MICEPPQKIIRSPLRYPGGKGAFYPYFSELMKQNEVDGGRYFEPFVGGAGVALGLLSSDMASEAILNDADYHIYCFWVSILKENERFIEEIQNAVLSIKEWQNQKAIYCQAEKYSVFEVAFATFYLNRCNRSGILSGAGPIGGYKQKGKWRLNARFNKDDLITRIVDIGALKGRMSMKNMDGIAFLKQYLPRGSGRKNVFAYIDPPYVSSGDRLYLNLCSDKDHKTLADYLLRQVHLKWIVTYDNASLIRKLYSSCQRRLFCLRYSLQARQEGEELLIAPQWLQLPNKNRITSNRWVIVRTLRRTG